MKRGPIGRFVLRWFISGLGIWIAAGLLGGRVDYTSGAAIILSGLLLAIANTLLKPIVVLLSLPAILFSLGLFMIVINGLMVAVVAQVYSGLHITSFGSAMIAGMIIGLVNYLVTTILEER